MKGKVIRILNAKFLLIIVFFQVHLFDIDIENVYKFTESSVLTPGKNITTFDVDGVKCGLAICFDMYFEEFAKCYRKAGQCRSIVRLFPSGLAGFASAFHFHF